MARSLTLSERAHFAMLAADKSRRRTVSRIMASPLMRWRYGIPLADQLLIVPPDLRTADPSFFREIQLDQFGLAGTIAVLRGHSPFDLEPPNAAWLRSLHGFSWLRHLEATASEEARQTALQLSVEWTIRGGAAQSIAGEPTVTARRLISWLSHAGLLLEGADDKSYMAIARALGTDLVRLSAEWREAPQGYPRLLALIALALADLSVAGHDRQLADTTRFLSAELGRQILPDGGHVSRNPAVLVELMLDLLPLRQCFASRKITPPPSLLAAMQRILGMLRLMRLGDGMLARFNGVSVAIPAGLATVLAYDDHQTGAHPTDAAASAYVRLERGGTVVIVDHGSPPPLELAGAAHAGCLSFEMSSGTQLLFVNGGAPGPADADWLEAARATASHNTLTVADRSSSELIRHGPLATLIGAEPIRGPSTVRMKIEDFGGNLELTARHDGYVDRFGLIHTRTLALSASGRRLLGIDRLEGRKGATGRVETFAIHFHLAPEVSCRRGEGSRSASLTLRNGEVWVFSVEGATLSIEESTFFADSAGPRPTLQLVARGTTRGATEVRWVAEARS